MEELLSLQKKSEKELSDCSLEK